MEKIFKKSLALVLSAALCLTALVGCLTVSAEGTTAKPTYALDAVEGKPGDNVTVTADITNVSEVCAHLIDIVFPTDLTLGKVTDSLGNTYLSYEAWVAAGSNSETPYYNPVANTDGNHVRLVEFINWPSGDDAISTTSMKLYFECTIPTGATAGTVYDIIPTVQAGKYDDDTNLMDVALTPGKITVASADTEVNVTFRHNINFASKLDILFAVPTSSFADCESVYIVVEKELYDTTGAVTGTETTTINEYDLTSLSGHYAFYYGGTLAKEMGSKVTAVVYGVKADGTKVYTQRDNYSVLDYVKNRLSKTTNEKEKTALVNLMDYGTAAQNYFKYNTSNLVIDSIASSFLSYRGTLDESVVTDAFTSTPNDGATVTLRKNMSFASSIEIIVGFVTSATDLKVKFDYTDINGIAQTSWVNSDQFKTDSGLTYASFTAFTALEMDKVVTATLYSGDSPISDTITYSVYSYSSTRLARTDAFGTLIREMVKYGQSVKAFKNK